MLADRDTPLLEFDAGKFRRRFAAGVAILFGLVPIVWFLLQRPHGTEKLVKVISAAVALALVWLTLKHRVAREKRNMWAYLILTIGSLVFWALYQMAPSGLQLFAVNNVNRKVWGIEVAPQWIQNINTVVIVVGGPSMSALFVRLRARGWKIDVPKQFAVSLILMGLGFLALPVGIALADDKGMSAFSWLFVSYVFQSIGELLISPVGYAMIGKLAPRQHQGVMMGAWMLVTGLASVFAGDFSSMVPEPSEGSAVTTNPVYSKLFIELGCGSLVVGVVLVFLIPFLRKLITDATEAAPEEPAAQEAAAA
jgi:POT family proton-dependent oligopeptide transporter